MHSTAPRHQFGTAKDPVNFAGMVTAGVASWLYAPCSLGLHRRCIPVGCARARGKWYSRACG